MKTWRAWHHRERGVQAVETVILTALVAVALIALGSYAADRVAAAWPELAAALAGP